jgi:hypothetical protein
MFASTKSKQERALYELLSSRYVDALADPTPTNRDRLARALGIGSGRVRTDLEGCFRDPELAAGHRARMLDAYAKLDERADEFWVSLTQPGTRWLDLGAQLIRDIELAYELGAPLRAVGGESEDDSLEIEITPEVEDSAPKAPGVPVPFDDQVTTVYKRPRRVVTRIFGDRLRTTTPF